MVDRRDDKSVKGAKAADGDGSRAGTAPRVRRPAEARQARFAQSFSQIIAVLMRDQNFKNMRLADLEWLVLPPVMAGQFRLAHMPAPPRPGQPPPPKAADKTSLLVPVAVALWARVSPQVDKGLSENLDKPVRLRVNQWASGNIAWLMAVAGERRAIPKFLEQLKEAEFKGQEVKMRANAGDGTVVVKTL
jgi:hemolysin-activating ACP:hemolysin acyltransferase